MPYMAGRAETEDRQQPGCAGRKGVVCAERDVILPASRSAQCLAACTKPRVFTKWGYDVREEFKHMRLISSISVVLLLPLLATAQLTTSVIRGHVSDSSGAAVVRAQVKIVNTETNVERSITTNNDGDYEAPDLLRGT